MLDCMAEGLLEIVLSPELFLEEAGQNRKEMGGEVEGNERRVKNGQIEDDRKK